VGDLKAFFRRTTVHDLHFRAYVRNEPAMLAQDFTNDHELAGKALRIPIGSAVRFQPVPLAPGYDEALATSGDRRSILLISSASTISAEVLSQRVRTSIRRLNAPRNRTSTSGPSMHRMPAQVARIFPGVDCAVQS